MRNIYSSLIMLSLVLGTVTISFTSAIQASEDNLVNNDWPHVFSAHGEEMTTAANKSDGSGINIGLDLIADDITPLPPGQKATAVFIQEDGEGLNFCGGDGLNNNVRHCNFVFSYSINNALQLDLPNSGDYAQWNNFCDGSLSPWTLQNCINENSFGQIFKPSVSGELTAFTLDLTFLNESGGPIENLKFYLYEIDEEEGKLGSLLQVVTLDIDDALIKTDWTDYKFTTDDFHAISIPFTNISLTADTYYGVFPGGEYVPGELPGEGDEPVSVPLSDAALYFIVFLAAGTLILISRKTILHI